MRTATRCTDPPAPLLEITSCDAFTAQGLKLDNAAIIGVDFRTRTIPWDKYTFRNVVFLACTFQSAVDVGDVVIRGGLVFPAFPDVPYDAYRQSLYTWQELAEGWHDDDPESKSVDLRIYEHFERSGRDKPSIVEALGQRIHDHAVDSALRRCTEGRRWVGIMGGHATLRSDPLFAQVAEVARALTRSGYHVASGGGPGIMEAANLGAWMAPHPSDALVDAIATLSPSPDYRDVGYLKCAKAVLERYPQGAESLAIPTWFYGHEPSNLFATHIAKYFSNSIREDTLLAICTHGIVFAPGSAGTTQEIFQDAAQNHYATFGKVSPMVFFGSQRYARDTRLYATVKELAQGRPYADLLHLSDRPDEVVEWILTHPPIPA